MCLIVNAKAKIRRANKERVCYKILRKDGEQLLAPYFGTAYEVGVVVNLNKPLKLLAKGDELCWFPVDDNTLRIDEGLHSYVDVFDAMCHLSALCFSYEDKYVVAECKIPLGAHYVEGETVGGNKAYVSDKLIVERIF